MAEKITQKISTPQPANNDIEVLQNAIAKARDALLAEQQSDGHWCFPLEADCTIPAEYILMQHFLGEAEIDVVLEQKIARYLRRLQLPSGGWPLYALGDADISCSVKAYYALKLVGDDIHAPHMQKAREKILSLGGAAKSNVFTRITLALFGQVPWRATPVTPVEIMLLPKWFPFHLEKVSYWSRTVMVPLLILCSLKPQAKNPRDVHIPELFLTAANLERHYFSRRSWLNRIFNTGDAIARLLEPLMPKFIRNRAITKARNWFVARFNGEDGLGAIFPAMVNAYEALVILNRPEDEPLRVQAKAALARLLIEQNDEAYCQPCFSPVWDTGLAALALQAEGSPYALTRVEAALKWLKARQIIDGPADWQQKRPNLVSGGFAFQYRNDYYPDLDDTAVVAWAMHQSPFAPQYQVAIARAADWLVGMQSQNGGFASFDVDNTYYYLNEIPFADHGALLDPPTSDVSARVLTLFGLLKRPQDREAAEACLQFVFDNQEADGSWFGRWGTNYIYGTWSVLTALNAFAIPHHHPKIQKAVSWLLHMQRPDGSWGESNTSYFDVKLSGNSGNSTCFQTAWAILGLIAAGEEKHPAVKRGIAYLLARQNENGLWEDEEFTAPGFPRVFYLKYHGYSRYFPLWALSMYYKHVNHLQL